MLSEQLLIERAGNFTSSENYKLMAGWDKPEPTILLDDFGGKHVFNDFMSLINDMESKPLVKDFEDYGQKVTGKMINQAWALKLHNTPPAGLVTYAQEKALETLFDYDPSLNFETVHTRNGEERELEAIKRLEFETGLKFDNTGENQAHIHDGEVGCTPDGILLNSDFSIKTGCEIKCKSPLAHARNLLINNNDDLKQNEFEHYAQIQTHMLCTDAKKWYFANFNPFAKSEKMQFKYIIIKRDDAFISIMKQRIETAKKIKAEFLENFKEFEK